MATMLQGESRRMYSWWWDSHISPKNSKWLQENLTDMDRNVKSMIKLIEEDADSFARRAEMYYKKRPELMKLVEEFYRAYRALAERYDHATGALRQAHRTMAEAFPNQIPPFLPDDSPSPSSADIGPHTPEIPSPLRSQLDPDESNNNFHARRRNIANFEENDSLSNKKGLKQLKEFFPEGKVRKVLKFKEEGIESEIKLLQEEVSQLSSKNEKFMSHMALESQRARELEETVSKLESVKEATLLQYKLSMERLTSLGNDISNTREELNTVNDEMVRKLNSVEEQCNAMEKVNKSLQFELESQRKELEEKGRKLEELNTQRAEEHEKRMQAEVALTSLQKVHTHTQEEAELLVLDIQRRNEKLKDMELRKASLEEKISELNETISNLHEQNVSVNAKIKDLQDEMKLLKEAKVDLECELGIRFEENKALTQEKEVVSEKNVVLERSLSDVNVELEGSREKASALESSCETLLSEVSTHIIEKGVLESQIEIISKNMEKLTEKSNLLENSLSDANVELDGLRVRCRNLEESCRSLSDQNSTLLAEKSDLVSEAENLETKYLELQGQHLTLERERDSTAHQVIKLQNSLILEKQENEALVSSLSTQLSSSHNQIVLLREENHQKAAVIETEQQKAMNSQLEIFILQRCLCDMKDKNILLQGECHNLLEAYTTAEDEIYQLRHNELIQKKELRSISENNEVLRNGTCMLLTTLSINGMHKNVDDITDGELVQNVLGEIKNLMNSISDARDENQQLHLKEENLESKYLEMQDKFSILEREKDSTIHQIMELQSSLRLEKQEHGTLISSLSSQLASLHDQISLLQDENQLKVEVVEMEQQKVMNCLLEIFILQSCLCDLNEKNIFLYGELQNLLEASRITENQIFNLKHNELIKKKEITLLLEDNDVLRNGIRMLLEALSADGKHKNVVDFTNEELVETILGEIKCLMHSISDTQDKNQQLHLKVMDLETKYVTLQEQIANLEREKDSKAHQVLELEDCFRLEKQEHEANILSFSSQLASLQSRTHLLQEEILVKDESFDREQQKAIFADLENFVLNRCLCDMKDKNLVLVETLQCAEKRIFELEHKDLIQKKELALLLNHGEILRASIHQLAQELNIDIKNRSMDDVSDEELLQNILGETKSMATSISDVQDENQQLHLKVSDLERKYLTLQDHHTNLEKEKDSAVNKAIKLEDSLRLQKQNHETIIISFSSQLASLQNQMHLLQQENFVKDEELEIEQQKAINVDLKNFVLHRCLCDMKDKNLILLEELKCAEKQICELGDEKLIQKKELSLLSNNSEIIRANIHLLLQELNIDMKNGSKDDSKDEVLLQNILGKVRDLLRSVSDAHDENQRLGLEELVLVTLFKEIGSDKFHLHQELESRTKELVALASEKNELTVINEQLKDEKDFFVSQVNLIKQTVEILEKKNPQLEERNLKLESEKDSAFNQVFELENSLKLEKQEHHGFVLSSESKLSSLRTQLHLKENEFETEQEKSMNALLENFILKRCLHDMKESNVMLSGECRQLLEASKCLEEEKSHLRHDLVRQNEELLSAQIKKNEAMETNELLKAEMHLSHQRSQTEICSLLEDNRSLSKRLCSLKEKVNELEQEINDVLVEALALDELFIFFKTLSTERGLNVKLLSEDIRAQNKRMRELEAEIINLKESTFLKEYDLNMARNLCEEFNRQIDTLKHKLTQKDMELSEAREENREFYGKVEDAKVMRKELEMEIKSLSSVITSKNEETNDVQVSNGLLHKQLERLNCELEKEMNEIFKCEGEIEALLNDVHISTVDAAIYEEKVLELIVACERVEFVSKLQRVPLCEEIAQKSALVDDLKKKLEDIEGENATSKRDFNALFDGLGCLEEQIFSLVKLQEKQDNGNSDILQHKISHQPSELDLQQLIVKVEVLQKMIVDTKNILEQERLNSKAKIEAARTEIEELKLKEVLLQEISKEKYGQAIKDIQLDKVSKSRTNSYSRNKNRNAKSDDQMLELWETAERDNIELVEEIKSEYPSCELNSEKEPSIEKLEVSAGVDESPEQWNKRFVEKLGSDAQRLVVLERSLHQLKAKLESSEKKKHPKTLEHGTLKVQLKEAEVAILEQGELNGELKKKVEENLITEERKHISEQAREGSEKIGKMELVLQKIEYIFLKANEEEEDKKIGCIDRKSSILLSEYIYGKDDGKGKKKSRFCGCMRPKTKG